ncbi:MULTISPECIES: geranylgeranyl reductase family protein [Gordonia]|uniref:Geranylgeranyl reductase family protein n=1 Tax=Gordonia amicalis TaxID=89053 RepID=A0AAE4R6D4_9ACTN|nr:MULTISPECIES: geranylgeranyl reductase family protein [Gordonia]ATD69746.1 FAD-linked oxidoreductase [Gordonia sp. 1D]KAF0968575.1 Menaquinone reductase [Gordonia sp. YY1]MBA5846849.1 geranylgeranyl reductase family protein [Gordonia amicalis]MCZ0911798.1 geranylgeranyl reductase family protein [Gordonia amicalis]MCZ4579313.1 geranylgeranyl reductase family protein [Gordonia amicalis]
MSPEKTTPQDAAPFPDHADVLVVGAGPGGSAAAAHAAAAGRDVVLVDAAVFPRDKTCGDGLTPRAVAELDALGLGSLVADRPRIDGLLLNGWGARQQVRWPSGRFPAYGSAVARTEFDDAIRAHAVRTGVRMVEGAKAIDVTMDGDRVGAVTFSAGGDTHTVRVGDLIVADGVRSGLGKALGREWHRDTAYGVAARAYAPSARADSHWMGSHLELRGPEGELLPGYGWVFPLGAAGGGLVNVGVGALATSKRPAHMALRPILEHYAAMVQDEWALGGPPVRIASALLPMGGAVTGVAGRNWMLIGDAAACVNPLNGEGIDYAMETARLAVELLGADDYTDRWRDILVGHYGLAFSAARRLAGLLTMPQTVPTLGRPGIRSPQLMSLVVRVMGNLITDEDADLVARAWRTVGRISSRIDPRPPFA